MIDEPTLDLFAHSLAGIRHFSTFYVPYTMGFIFISLVYLHLAIDMGERWYKAIFLPLFAIYFGMMIGSLFGVFLNGRPHPWHYWTTRQTSEQLRIIFSPFTGDKVLYGGFFGMILGVFLFSLTFYGKRWKTAFYRHLDAFSIATPLLFMFNRFGCTFYGCCYGKRSDFGVVISPAQFSYRQYVEQGIIKNGDVLRLIPTQQISLWANFTIFMVLFFLYRKYRSALPPLFYFWLYTLLYGTFRFTIEFFRADRRDFFFGLSTSQWIPILLFTPAVLFLVKFFRTREKNAIQGQPTQTDGE